MEGVHYSHLTIVRGEQDSRTVDSKAYYYEHVWSVLATHLAHKILDTVFDGWTFSPALDLCQNLHDQNPCK